MGIQLLQNVFWCINAQVVGSYDMNAVAYMVEVRAQPSRQEVITDMQDIMQKMLKGFFKNCGMLIEFHALDTIDRYSSIQWSFGSRLLCN